MGAICQKKSVEIEANVHSDLIEFKQCSPEELAERRLLLFQTEELETNFLEMSTPRNGKTIRWKSGSLIGEGAYAKVFQGLNLDTGELIAIKHFKFSEEPQKLEKQFLNSVNEVALLRYLRHPNIVNYYQTDLSPSMDSVSIIMEYIERGSLKRLLLEFGPLDETIIRNYSIQILKGLVYLHENNVIHRDLKSANILINAKGEIKLTDFGASHRFETPGDEITRSMKGSPFWIAPEIVLRMGHSYEADIWSYGCVLIEMLTSRPPWSNYSRLAEEVLELISIPNMLPIIPGCSTELESLLISCLERHPSERPTAAALLKHPFHTNENGIANKQEDVQLKIENASTLERIKLEKEEDSLSFDREFDKENLIKIQGVLRGFLDRQAIRITCSEVFANMTRGRLHRSRTRRFTINEMTTLPNLYSELIDEIEKRLGKFNLEYEENPDLILRNPVDIDRIAIYIGQWNAQNEREGGGVQIWTDKSKYEGEWKNDRANGFGRLIHSDGDVYEGDWLNNKAHGKGKYYHEDGAIYTGDWKNDKEHGKGREKWPDGSWFQGEYKFGKKNGEGIFKFSDGSKFEGNFLDNNLDGYGVYEWVDGRKFAGDWKENKMHGRGRFSWNDGRTYIGDYWEDKKEGYGVFTWPDGRKYEGEWYDGKEHGKGLYFTALGDSKEGVWKRGKRLK